jgi:hypothetical protein
MDEWKLTGGVRGMGRWARCAAGVRVWGGGAVLSPWALHGVAQCRKTDEGGGVDDVD